jgi:hypothetical protein
MFNSSGPLTDIKLTPDSLAMALASKVLPQPGGPTMRIPGGFEKLNISHCRAYLTGAFATFRI